MSFELYIQKSVIVLTKIDSGQNHGIFVSKFEVGAVVNFFQSDADVLASLEHVGGLSEGSFGVIGVKDFLDLFFFVFLLVAFFVLFEFFEDIFFHSGDEKGL